MLSKSYTSMEGKNAHNTSTCLMNRTHCASDNDITVLNVIKNIET